MKLLKLPVIKPNTAVGATIIDCTDEDKKIGYPAGTQPDLYISPQHIVLVKPDGDGYASIYLIGNPTAHRVAMTADAVAKEVESALS